MKSCDRQILRALASKRPISGPGWSPAATRSRPGEREIRDGQGVNEGHSRIDVTRRQSGAGKQQRSPRVILVMLDDQIDEIGICRHPAMQGNACQEQMFQSVSFGVRKAQALRQALAIMGTMAGNGSERAHEIPASFRQTRLRRSDPSRRLDSPT